MRRFAALVLALLTALSVLPGNAAAASDIALDQWNGSLNECRSWVGSC